jgi:hypothetical protein
MLANSDVRSPWQKKLSQKCIFYMRAGNARVIQKVGKSILFVTWARY